MIGPERLRELEPHAAGRRAVHVPETGIVDYRAVCQRLVEQIQQHGGSIRLNTRVLGFRSLPDGAIVETTSGDLQTEQVVNCTGLQSDRVARKLGAAPRARIIPFRGEYYQLKSSARHLCRNLIYPVPDPAFPFLGVHFTRMIDGSVECGPNAVLSLAREGYHKFAVNLPDALASLAYGGFWKLARRHWRMGASEIWRSWSKRAFVRALQRLVPEIRADDLLPAEPGIRAQALLPDGRLEDDFVIQESARVVHVLNAPSPAATSSLNIASIVVDELASRLPT
jgi:L-2-hydroxyglutarate oxidase